MQDSLGCLGCTEMPYCIQILAATAWPVSMGKALHPYTVQYNTILRTSIVPASLVWPSSKALQARKHETENICPQESQIRHQEIRKSATKGGCAGPSRCFVRRCQKQVKDSEEQIHRRRLFQREAYAPSWPRCEWAPGWIVIACVCE